MVKKYLNYRLLFLILVTLAMSGWGLQRSVEAADQPQQCTTVAISQCFWQNAGMGYNRIVQCPSGYILTALDLFCSADCGDQDEDWVRAVQCCKVTLE